MKKFLLAISIACLATAANAQKFKFGNIPEEDLKMTVYEPDTTAAAVVLYESVTSTYGFRASDFIIVTDRVVRIKVLKPEGASQADIAVMLRKGGSNENSESISNLNASAYNLENGKVVQTKLTKDYIFTEETSKY